MKKLFCFLGIHKFYLSKEKVSVEDNISYYGKKVCLSKKCKNCGSEKVMWSRPTERSRWHWVDNYRKWGGEILRIVDDLMK